MPTSLNFLIWNVENLFLLSDTPLQAEDLQLEEGLWQKKSTSLYENKSLRKLKQMAQMIRVWNPDILALCEVGGLESLENFNRLFLNSSYSCALVEGNSDRHIDVGYLVKKDLGFHFDLVSNRTRSLNFLYPHEVNPEPDFHLITAKPPAASHRFSRDVAELHLFKKDLSERFAVVLLTHLKSRLDPDGIDPQGALRRGAEFRTLMEVYQEVDASHGQQLPIVVCGDFNGTATGPLREPQFDLLAQIPLREVCDLAGLSADQRCSFYQIQRQGRLALQLDYAFLSPAAQKLVVPSSVGFRAFLSPKGDPLPPPQSLQEKLDQVSDHYPLSFTLDFSLQKI